MAKDDYLRRACLILVLCPALAWSQAGDAGAPAAPGGAAPATASGSAADPESATSGAAAAAAAGAAAESAKRIDTLRYGIESQVIELLGALRSEKNDAYKDAVLETFDTATSPRLKSAVLDYLAAMSLSDGESRAAAVIADRDNLAEALVNAAFSYLVAIRSAAPLSEAVEILEGDEKRYLAAAIKAIGAAGSAAEAAALRKAYEADGAAPAVKEAVVLALGAMKSAESFELLASAASSDESGKALRMFACTALGDLGDERSVPVLVGASVSGDPNVRAAAIAALGKYDTKQARTAVREGLRDPHVLPRAAAAKAAGAARDADAVPYLEFKASYDPERSVRDASIAALGDIGGQRVDDYLCAFFEETKNPAQYRSAALAAVVAKGGEAARARALAAFVAAQAAKDRALFNAYARAVTALEAPGVVPFAEAMLADKEFSVRLGAVAWAERNRSKELEAKVRTLSESDANEAVRKRAVQALERLGR